MSIADGVFALAVAMGVSGLVVDGVVRMVPDPQTDTYFHVESVRAVRRGDTADLWVDRSIHSPLHMTFSVRIMQQTDGGWREFCAVQSDPILYQPDAVIDHPVTLDWWTRGECASLPDGPARIVTTWAPTARNLQPVTYIAEVE